jgi:hypothetical protein
MVCLVGDPRRQDLEMVNILLIVIRGRSVAATVSWCLLGVACSLQSGSQGAGASSPACSKAATFGVSGTPNEVRGTIPRGELWGLALGPGHVPPRSGDELKIVWRMTGRGPLRVAFTAPDGRRRPLVFGPEFHTTSDYHRPGEEWGTGFRFSAPGCWHIKLTRGTTSGDVWLNVRR